VSEVRKDIGKGAVFRGRSVARAEMDLSLELFPLGGITKVRVCGP